MTQPTEERTRTETPREKMLKRTEACVVCACEKYEFEGRLDGYDMCVCRHSQWGHKLPGGVL